jgi:monoterpene epsilon-lactone hydrolase
MPSRLHAVYARVVPRVRRAEEMGGPEPQERDRVVRWHLTLDRSFPTRAVPGFHRRFSVVREELGSDGVSFPAYVVTPRSGHASRTLLYLHGGGYMAPIDPFLVRFIIRLATALGARVVMPDYPLAPEHTWRDSHDAIVALAGRWAGEPGGTVLVGDSSGGGYALAVAIAQRDRGGPQATHLVLHSPWVDLTTSTPETDAYDEVDPWLFVGKMRAYALWWAGSPDDLGRPEVSPALADLEALPPGLMFCGTRDLLLPGCRLLARRASEAGWSLTYVERPGLIHAFPVLPFLPEARVALRQTVAFLEGRSPR